MRLGFIIGMCLMLLVVAVTMMSCTTKGLSYESGLAKYEAKQYDEALLVFQSIADSGGRYANRARYYMGECYKLKFNWEEATKQFQMVIDAEPPVSYLASEARSRIAQIREGKVDIERIEIIRDNFAETDPKRASSAMLELGSVYENKLNDYDNAIKAYRDVIDKFPGSENAAQAQVNIGNVYFYKLYDYVGGWPEFLKINAENYPDLKYRVSEIESLLRDINKTRQEIAEHQQFIRKSQKTKLIEGSLITGYDLYGARDDQVAQEFVAVAKKWKSLKNYPKALEAFRMCIDRLPMKLQQAAESRYNIGEIYQQQGRYYEAIDGYREYIKYHPTDFSRDKAIYNMAIVYESLRDYENVYERYKTYRDTYPEGKFYKTAELKVRQYEYDEDQDGFPYYKELIAGTKDTDANDRP